MKKTITSAATGPRIISNSLAI